MAVSHGIVAARVGQDVQVATEEQVLAVGLVVEDRGELG
jgi:hypothetical protein